MNSPRILAALLVLAPLAVPVLGGCNFIHAPDPLPTPTPVPTPFGVQFNPADGAPVGTALNKAGDPVLPDAFRTALVVSGQEVVLQRVDTPPGSTTPNLSAADTLNPVRLAGIVAPTGSQTGAAESAAELQKWTAGQDLDVQIDPVYPVDTDNKRRVAIFFKEREGEFKDQVHSLNRMMVRRGFAIVDLYSPTSFDQKQWLLDETYARENNLGLWKTNTFRILQQRVKLPSRGTGAQAKVGLTLPVPGAAPAGSTTTTETTTAAVPAAAPTPAP